MKRLLFLCLLAAAAWLQFELFPGHTYLAGDTQMLVPALEHLQHPGLLTRDLVAMHPALTYTLYDEITLFLQRSGWDLRRVLEAQQIAFRFFALLGLFLLASQALSRGAALIVSVVVCLGGYAFGPSIPLIDPDPQPAAFALCASLLAAGLFASSRPLLAGLFGGIALIYDAPMAAPIWIIAILATFFSKQSRRMFRASMPILAVFALLLANASQLQPAIPETRDFFERLPPAIAVILRFRMPELWVTNWFPLATALYVVLIPLAWYTSRLIRPRLSEPARWVLLGLPVAGVAGMLASAVLFDGFGWAMVPEWQPGHLLAYTLLLTSLLCGMAAWQNRKLWPIAALPVFLPLTNQFRRPAVDCSALAAWAELNTWGGSLFLFPDAGRSLNPGAFRSESRRAVWVDWQTGGLSANFDSFADEWYRRWKDTMTHGYAARQLRSFASLPLDYFVLQRAHALPGMHPVYEDRSYVVYDVHDFRRGG